MKKGKKKPLWVVVGAGGEEVKPSSYKCLSCDKEYKQLVSLIGHMLARHGISIIANKRAKNPKKTILRFIKK